jgi:hypothetical protein
MSAKIGRTFSKLAGIVPKIREIFIKTGDYFQLFRAATIVEISESTNDN